MESGYLWRAEEAGARQLLFPGSQGGPGAGSAGSHGDLAADGEDVATGRALLLLGMTGSVERD